MTTTVYLPYRFEIGTLYPFLNSVVRPNGEPYDDHFIFNFQYLGFIDGTGFTALYNTLEWLGKKGVRRQFARPSELSAAITYLDDCGFFEKFLGRRLRPNSRARSTTLPCSTLSPQHGHGWLEARFTPWLADVLDVQAGAIASVKTCMREIFNNIADHSTEHIGCVHLQHYPQLKRVKLTVSDFGRGIPDTIRLVRPGLDDAQAILTASTEGVTTMSSPQNRGVGLDFLVTHVAGNNGTVGIYSYSGSLICGPGEVGVADRQPFLMPGSYPGTMVDISLRTDCFVGDEAGTEELEW